MRKQHDTCLLKVLRGPMFFVENFGIVVCFLMSLGSCWWFPSTCLEAFWIYVRQHSKPNDFVWYQRPLGFKEHMPWSTSSQQLINYNTGQQHDNQCCYNITRLPMLHQPYSLVSPRGPVCQFRVLSLRHIVRWKLTYKFKCEPILLGPDSLETSVPNTCGKTIDSVASLA